jgi:hypothetical protein
MDDREVRQIAEIVDQVVARRMGGGMNPTPTSSGGGGGATGQATAAGQMLINATTNVANSLGMMAAGTYKATDAMGDAGKILEVFGPLGGALSTLGKDVGKFAFGMNDSLNDVSKSGFTFGQDLGLFAKSVTSARMSIPEFQDFIKNAGEQVAGLGMTARDSGIRFLQMGKDMQETEFGKRLVVLGMGTEELNNALKLTAATRRSENMTDATVRKAAVDSAIQMATEFDNVARLTGRSRQKQQEAMEKEQARLDRTLAIQGMTAEQKKVLEGATNVAGLLGEAGVEVARIFALGGPKNAEDQRAVVAMPEEMRSLILKLTQIQGTPAEQLAQREAIREQILAEAQRGAENKQLNTNLSNMVQSGNEQLVAMGRTQIAINQLGNSMIQMQGAYSEAVKNKEFTGTFEQFKQAQLQAIADLRDPKKNLALLPGGEAAATAQAINAANALLKATNAAVAGEFNKLTNEIGQTLVKQQAFHTLIGKLTVEDIPAAMKNVTEYIKAVIGDSTGNRGSKAYERESAKDQGAKADGGDVFAGQTYPIETPGFEMFSPKVDGSIINNNVLKALASNVNSLQNDLKSSMSNKGNDNSSVLGDLKDMLAGMKIPADKVSVSGNMPSAMTSSSGSSSSNTEVTDLLRTLNTSIVRLTETVDSGSQQQVRAVKSQGNLIP